MVSLHLNWPCGGVHYTCNSIIEEIEEIWEIFTYQQIIYLYLFL